MDRETRSPQVLPRTSPILQKLWTHPPELRPQSSSFSLPPLQDRQPENAAEGWKNISSQLARPPHALGGGGILRKELRLRPTPSAGQGRQPTPGKQLGLNPCSLQATGAREESPGPSCPWSSVAWTSGTSAKDSQPHRHMVEMPAPLALTSLPAVSWEVA